MIFSVIVQGEADSLEELLELTQGWTLHPGARVVSASVVQAPPEGSLPYVVGEDARVRIASPPA